MQSGISTDITDLKKLYEKLGVHFPEGVNKETGHFNVFSMREVHALGKRQKSGWMPYNRRTFYKISLINGRNRAEYADKVIEIDNKAVLFATPRIPYHYVPQDENQDGFFCIFTDSFLRGQKNGLPPEDLPIYKPGSIPIYHLTDEGYEEMAAIFRKMQKELASDYAFKYDLLRNYLMELIHYGQKLQPATPVNPPHKAANRVATLFIELLERQFPIDSMQQQLGLRTAKDYADQLAIHVNYLNKSLKETTGHTTTDIISSRVLQEAKVLLKHTNWNVSEIAWCLGFEEIAHFSNFFRKHTDLSPLAFRS